MSFFDKPYAVTRGEMIRLWKRIYQLEDYVMGVFDRLESDVAAQTTVVGGLITSYNSLAQQVRDIGGPKANALADQIEANTNSMAAAVVANTPVANEPIPPVDPVPTT